MRLQCEIFGYMNSKGAQARRAIETGRDTSFGKCLASRIRGKEGRVGGKLGGKRVNLLARSVITPVPTLDFDHVSYTLIFDTLVYLTTHKSTSHKSPRLTHCILQATAHNLTGTGAGAGATGQHSANASPACRPGRRPGPGAVWGHTYTQYTVHTDEQVQQADAHSSRSTHQTQWWRQSEASHGGVPTQRGRLAALAPSPSIGVRDMRASGGRGR